ncbi:MAG: hypothetical protein KC917_19440 [Candidatus Omnitrophica bacterium]|nr:hypothetical protein [Candidatus Omnitrophota bacterium]
MVAATIVLAAVCVWAFYSSDSIESWPENWMVNFSVPIREAFLGEEGLYQNPPLWISIVFVFLTGPAWLYCRHVCSKKKPVQELPVRRSPSRPRAKKTEKDPFLALTDISTVKIRPDSIFTYIYAWRPVFFWTITLVVSFRILHVLNEVGSIEFLLTIGDRLGKALGHPFALFLFDLLYGVAFVVIFILFWGVPLIFAMMHFLQAIMSTPYLQILPARRGYVIGSTLLGIAVTFFLFTWVLQDEPSPLTERILWLALATSIAGFFIFFLQSFIRLEEITFSGSPETGQTKAPNIYGGRRSRTLRDSGLLVGFGWLCLVIPAACFSDLGYFHLAIAMAVAISLYSVWAMAWLWKRY